MKKRDELTQPGSCLRKAKDDELIFVLLGRDPAAPVAIRAWCQKRIELQMNTWVDDQVQTAYARRKRWKGDFKNRRKNSAKFAILKSEVLKHEAHFCNDE